MDNQYNETGSTQKFITQANQTKANIVANPHRCHLFIANAEKQVLLYNKDNDLITLGGPGTTNAILKYVDGVTGERGGSNISDDGAIVTINSPRFSLIASATGAISDVKTSGNGSPLWLHTTGSGSNVTIETGTGGTLQLISPYKLTATIVSDILLQSSAGNIIIKQTGSGESIIIQNDAGDIRLVSPDLLATGVVKIDAASGVLSSDSSVYVKGSGTTNYLLRYTNGGTGASGNSHLDDNGSRINSSEDFCINRSLYMPKLNSAYSEGIYFNNGSYGSQNFAVLQGLNSVGGSYLYFGVNRYFDLNTGWHDMNPSASRSSAFFLINDGYFSIVSAPAGTANLTSKLNLYPNGYLGLGANIIPESIFQIGTKAPIYETLGVEPLVNFIGDTVSTSPQTFLRLYRKGLVSGVYQMGAGVDFDVLSYGTGGGGDNFAPKTQLNIKLKGNIGAPPYYNWDETANITVMSLRDNGNVGIGRTDPPELMSIKSVSGLQSAISLSSAYGSVPDWRIRLPASSYDLLITNQRLSVDAFCIVGAGGYTGSLVPYSGCVGVGTLTPCFKLHTNGEAYTDTYHIIGSSFSASATGAQGQYGAACVITKNYPSGTSLRLTFTITNSGNSDWLIYYVKASDGGHVQINSTSGQSSIPQWLYATTEAVSGFLVKANASGGSNGSTNVALSLDSGYLGVVGNAHVSGDIDISTGRKYKINGTNLSYGDIGAFPANHGASANYIPRATSTTAFGNSQITDDGSGVSIYPSMDLSLQSSGGAILLSNQYAAGKDLTINGNTNLYLRSGGLMQVWASGQLQLQGATVAITGTVGINGGLGVGLSGPDSGVKLQVHTGASTDFKVGQHPTSTTYNVISVNGSIAEGASAGLCGGGSAHLYVQSGSSGDIYLRAGTGSAYTVMATFLHGVGINLGLTIQRNASGVSIGGTPVNTTYTVNPISNYSAAAYWIYLVIRHSDGSSCIRRMAIRIVRESGNAGGYIDANTSDTGGSSSAVIQPSFSIGNIATDGATFDLIASCGSGSFSFNSTLLGHVL
jgi:hypothetical protein